METNNEQKIDGNQDGVQTSQDSNQEEQKFVPATAYKEVSSDMHKFKSRAKEAEAKAQELELRLKAIEEENAIKKQEFEKLWKTEKAEKERIEQERKRDKELYLRSVKLSALKNELGGNVKDEYLTFANIDAIELREDGTLSSESVQSVANSFRQAHPGLIAQDSSVNITGSPAASRVVNEKREKTLAEMSTEEKYQRLLEMKKQNRS